MSSARLPNMLLDVVHDAGDWLALYKPAGINMHSEDGEAGIVVLASQQLGHELFPGAH